MHLIRTAEELAALCHQPIDPDLLSLLGGYAAALEEFGADLEATIIVVEADDTIYHVEEAYGERLVMDGRYTLPVELVARHDRWFDIVRIISDDGSGLVLLVEIAAGTDPQLLAACGRALAEAEAW